jgi:hypothetical protein
MTHPTPTSQELAGPLARATSLRWDERTLAQLKEALAASGGGAADVLELSRARWGNEEAGANEALVVLTRETLVLVWAEKRGLFGGARTVVSAKPLSEYKEVGEDDDFLPHSVFIFGYDEDDTFLLNWADPDERHRMFKAIFSAQRGRFEQWGLQLDPAEYAADFDRYYGQMVAEGPADASSLHGWIEQRHGEFDLSNALGLASAWRYAELQDAAGADPSNRIGQIGVSNLWSDVSPEARGVVVRLGEKLADEGLLDPPYDEVSFETGEGLSRVDAGPARLIALMTLAGLARAHGHPRADEWIGAARRGIPSVPPRVFPPSLRDLWADIEALPSA